MYGKGKKAGKDLVGLSEKLMMSGETSAAFIPSGALRKAGRGERTDGSRSGRGNIFNSFCRHPSPLVTPSILESLTLSTAIKCVQRGTCTLHLSVSASLIMEESIRGLEICLLSLDTQETRCHSTRIPRVASRKMVGRMLQVRFDCFEVNVAQHVYVTLKTIPYYCEVQISREYHVEDCTNADVGRSIPACSGECPGRPPSPAGGLRYEVDQAQKAIRVRFTDIAEGQAYYVRLCLKWFACEDHSPPVLVSAAARRVDAAQPGKDEVSLPYAQLLPCLCIEGWAAVPDAMRVQICPFENG
ncbi:putative interleukin-17 receptor E-like, partial [Gracilinanus agilis]|uniref:putative interleukin-17 receptor E-like n=1 Tax=Gracilinanus agilis TaxID=191870 RepID=UPI001CFCBCD4